MILVCLCHFQKLHYVVFTNHLGSIPLLIRDPYSTWRKTDTVGFQLRELASRMALIWWQGLSPVSGA